MERAPHFDGRPAAPRPTATRHIVPLAAGLLLAACRTGVPSDGPSDDVAAETTETAAPSGTTTDTATTAAGPSAEALLAALDARDLDGHAGRVAFGAATNCCAAGDCLHMNPDSEYGTYALPPGPGEYTGDRLVDEDGTILTWRLRQDEAVLYIGPKPPGSTYVSFRSYIHDIAVPGGRRVTFTSLGDSLNHLVWGENPDGTLIVVTTANAGTLRRVEEAAGEVGWPVVNLDGIPVDVPTMGLGRLSDTYHVTLRMTGLEPALSDPWVEAPTGRVFRVTPRVELPESPLALTSRASAPQPPVTDDVTELEAAIALAFPDFDAEVVAPSVVQPPDDGSCWSGCNRDVSYRTAHEAELGPRDLLVAYGADPAAYGRAVWTAIVLHGMDESDAAGVFGSDGLAGTAQAYLPGAPDAHYAVAFSRDCSGVPHCTTVPDTCPGLGLEERGQLAWRHYLDPATGTFPPAENLGPHGMILLVPRETSSQ